jgi:hypothetical protein
MFAFDGKDSDEDGEVDLADLDEISWDVTASLDEVGEAVSTFTNKFGANALQPRVLYHEPRWFRELNGAQVYVLEYWFYYPYDQGTGGHKGDSEHFFVFVSLDRRATAYSLEVFRNAKVVGVVGAGHEAHTANNILVAGTRADFGKRILPESLPQHMPVIVERGKHGSAPDRDFNGRYDVGADSNVFRRGAWGSRDVQTDSAGRLFGRFQGWFSFPRSFADVVVESQFRDPSFYDAYHRWYPREFPPLNGENETSNASVLGSRTYTLFPLADLQELYGMLRDDSRGRTRLAQDVRAFLHEHRDCFWADPPDRVEVTVDAVEAMQAWADKHAWQGKAHNIELLEHRDHRNPNNIFKLHLYPTIAAGARYKVDGQTNNLLEASIRIGELAVFGREWLPDSMIEVNTSFDMDRGGKWYDTEVQYWFFRGGYTGMYAGIAARKEYLASADELDQDVWQNSLNRIGIDGLDFEETSQVVWPVDVGVALTFNLFRRLIVDAKGGLRTEIFRDRPTDLEIARGAEDKLRFIFSVGFKLGIANPTHPLNH